MLNFDDHDLRLSRYRGVLSYLNIKEPYHPERLARQFGWHQTIPLEDVIRPISSIRPCEIKVVGGDFYTLTFSPVVDRWDRRADSLIPIGERARVKYAMDEEYMHWHLRRTHPYILRTSADNMVRMRLPELDPNAVRISFFSYKYFKC